VELHLGHHPPRLLPTLRLVEEALVPEQRFVRGPVGALTLNPKGKISLFRVFSG
jgi:hypothetical protein